MIKSEFMELYEELSILTEDVGFDYSTNKYTKEALDAFEADKDAKGVVIFTSEGKNIYKICQLYHDDRELQRINYYIEKLIPHHNTVWAVHSRGTAEDIRSKLTDTETGPDIKYIELPELVDKDLVKRTFKQQIMAGDWVEVLEDKYPAMYKSLMRHHNTNIFKVDHISLMLDFEKDGDNLSLVLPNNNEISINELQVKKLTEEEVKKLTADKTETEEKSVENSEEPKAEEKPEENSEPKNAKLNKARLANKKIIKTFKELGLPIDDLIATATNKNGREYKKASEKLNKLRKGLFGESLEDDTDELDYLDE